MDDKSPYWSDYLKKECEGDMPWFCGEEDCDYCLPCGKYTVTIFRLAEAHVQAQIHRYAVQAAPGPGLTAIRLSIPSRTQLQHAFDLQQI
jgi:hypothetical protein